MTSPNELTYFTVTGNWFDVEAPITSGSDNTPQVNDINAFVTFTARLKPGTVAYVANLDQTIGGGTGQANTAVALAPVTARILEGELQVINRADTPDVKLVANTAVLGLSAPLLYDVAFTHVTYAGATQTLLNFAFTAPTAAATVDLTDPVLARLPYDPTNYPT